MTLPLSRWLRPLAAVVALGGCLVIATPASAALQLGTWSGTGKLGKLTAVVQRVKVTADNGTTTRVVSESLQMVDPQFVTDPKGLGQCSTVELQQTFDFL